MYRKDHDMLFEVEERPRPLYEGNARAQIRITGESAVALAQSYNGVGKLLNWCLGRDGTWQGVIISGGYRWTFSAKDIQCKESDLVEGQQVSFRSLLPEDGRGLGYADSVRPYQSEPPKLETSARRQLPERNHDLRLLSGIPPQLEQTAVEQYGEVEFYGPESKAGVISADGISYPFNEVDVICGIPQTGVFAKFRVVDGRAVEVELA